MGVSVHGAVCTIAKLVLGRLMSLSVGPGLRRDTAITWLLEV